MDKLLVEAGAPDFLPSYKRSSDSVLLRLKNNAGTIDKHLPGRHDQLRHGRQPKLYTHNPKGIPYKKPLTKKEILQRQRAGKKRSESITPEHMRMLRARVQRSSLVESGKRGYQEAIKRYGKYFAADKAAEYRRKNPSILERKTSAWLDEVNEPYEREVHLVPGSGVYVDFLLKDRRLVIECDEEIWHSNDPLHGSDREKRDVYKTNFIKAQGYKLLRFPGRSIVTGEAKLALYKELGIKIEKHLAGQHDQSKHARKTYTRPSDYDRDEYHEEEMLRNYLRSGDSSVDFDEVNRFSPQDARTYANLDERLLEEKTALSYLNQALQTAGSSAITNLKKLLEPIPSRPPIIPRLQMYDAKPYTPGPFQGTGVLIGKDAKGEEIREFQASFAMRIAFGDTSVRITVPMRDTRDSNSNPLGAYKSTKGEITASIYSNSGEPLGEEGLVILDRLQGFARQSDLGLEVTGNRDIPPSEMARRGFSVEFDKKKLTYLVERRIAEVLKVEKDPELIPFIEEDKEDIINKINEFSARQSDDKMPVPVQEIVTIGQGTAYNYLANALRSADITYVRTAPRY